MVAPSMFGDRGRPGFSVAEGRAALFRDGQPVFEESGYGLGMFPLPPFTVPPEPSTYRLELELARDAEHNLEHFEFTRRVSAAWTFRSQHVQGTERLALPTLVFTPELDEHNAVRRHLPLLLPVTIERPAGAPTPAIATATIEASFDHGATWSAVPGFRVGTQWYGAVLHPPRATYVSLRGTATDVLGTRVEQTTIRAYKLKP